MKIPVIKALPLFEQAIDFNVSKLTFEKYSEMMDAASYESFLGYSEKIRGIILR